MLIADTANNRLLTVTPEGQVSWRFPQAGDLPAGTSFRVPDDAFFTADGQSVVATQEDDFVISLIGVDRRRLSYRYGQPGNPGAGANQLFNPDDAISTSTDEIVAADIKNCRLVVIDPPAHRLQRQVGSTGGCVHDPPNSFSSPNGAFPTSSGGLVVTEIGGNWADVLRTRGQLLAALPSPGFSYPSDTNEVSPGVLLSADYSSPGAVEEFDLHGHVLWRYAPRSGPGALDHPSLALPLPNGNVLLNDNYNARVVVIDRASKRIVWQYGHTGQPGSSPGYLNIPDGVDLAPPYALVDRFPGLRPPTSHDKRGAR